MDAEVIVPTENAEETSRPAPFPKTRWGKIIYALFVIVMPAMLFPSVELWKPEWQTGRFPDYVILSLLPQASLVFFPLLAYSIICYWLLLFDSVKYSSRFVVRLGIYTGTILALQYCVTALIASSNSSGIFTAGLWLGSIGLIYLYRWVVRRWGQGIANRILIIIALGGLLAGFVIHSPFPALLLIGLALVAPFWIFLLALRASVWLFKQHETGLNSVRFTGMAAWLTCYLVAWRFDILKMYELYAALPPQPPPDCYIATAAAQGHAKFVGAKIVVRGDGSSLSVNRQLQILKCAELALMAIHPRAHAVLRRCYDFFGRPLARRIHNPWAADLAYISLKPCERLSRWILRIMIPEIDTLAKNMYSDR